MRFAYWTGLLLSLSLSACAGDEVDTDLGPKFDDKADLSECAGYDGGHLSGDDLLVLINKGEGQQLAKRWAPRDLVSVDDHLMIPGREATLRLGVLQAYEKLASKAELEMGLDLRIRSAYRSFATQCRTFAYWVDTKGLEHAQRFSAEPGRSQHQLGTTIDITSEALGYENSSGDIEATEYTWLAENAHRFGFALAYPKGEDDTTGYGFEPWHYRFIGHEAALEMHDAGLILETYLLACQNAPTDLQCPQEELAEVIPNDRFIGGMCEAQEDCRTVSSDAVCLDEEDGYPGGQCALPCEASCPDRAGANAVTFCVVHPTDEFVGLCHSRCDDERFPGSGCRDGYSCVEASRPSGSTGMVCLPR
ncbi:MAG: M15 family metallopeptidase [Myxococcales bacterium]|nr:M15 family metallopeptidase [Myxococcales bacterium]